MMERDGTTKSTMDESVTITMELIRIQIKGAGTIRNVALTDKIWTQQHKQK